MAIKYYQFDYAEMSGFEIKRMGIINVECAKNITKENLKDLARKHLQTPDANIVISNIAKIERSEFDAAKGYRIS